MLLTSDYMYSHFRYFFLYFFSFRNKIKKPTMLLFSNYKIFNENLWINFMKYDLT